MCMCIDRYKASARMADTTATGPGLWAASRFKKDGLLKQ